MEQPPNMMPNGMPLQNMNTMQRPQPGNMNQQIHAKILHDLQQGLSQVGTGWQSTFDIKQRAVKVMQMLTSLRVLEPDLAKCIHTAQGFELRTVQAAPNREAYEAGMKAKLDDIANKRAQRANRQMPNGLQLNPNMPQNNMQNMPNNGMGNMNMPNGGMGMSGGQMNGNESMQQNSGFPAHLQRPMQPSPIPPTQQPNIMDPSALQQTPMQPQMPNMSSGQAQQQPNMHQSGSGEVNMQEVKQLAHNMYQKMPDEAKTQLRIRAMSSLNDQQRANAASAPGDPVVLRFLMQKAHDLVKNGSKGGRQGPVPQQAGAGMQMGGQHNMGVGNPSQTPVSQASVPDFTTILGQQANALKQMESGGEVVPASNNANVMNGMMNMPPQGVNPQMLGNQQGGGGQQMTNQMQQIMQQQHKENMMRRQNMLAQQQAIAAQQAAQANQLRGQPGGLNAPNALNGGPAGHPNSPAMSMLNRPMVPPGQATPGTPQQQGRQPAGQQQPQPPPTPQNTATMNLLQHHQQMMNQNNQQDMVQGGGQQGFNIQQHQQNQQQILQLVQLLPQSMRQKVVDANMPVEQLKQFIVRFRSQGMGGQQPPGNQQVMNGQPGGQPNMPLASTLGMPNMNAPGQGVPMNNGMPGQQNMHGNATPMFNAQPPPNQHAPSQMDPAQLQQRIHQQQQAQNNQLRQRAMDSRPFPKEILGQLGVSVPQDVGSWGRLKQHIMQVQNVLPPQTMEKVIAFQNQHLQAHPEEVQMAMAVLRQHVQGQQGQSGQQMGGPGQGGQQPSVSGPPQGMGMPNGQAPPAQMVPPVAPMVQQPPVAQPSPANQASNGPLGGAPQQPGMSQATPLRPPPPPQVPSMQEVAMFRAKYPQQLQTQGDDEIKRLIYNKKREGHVKAMQQWQQQEALRNAQLQRAQQGGAMPNAGPSNGHRQPQQGPQQGTSGQQPQTGGQAHGQKRQPQQAAPSSDDVVEIPNPNQPAPPQMGAPQAPPMQPSKSQQARGNMQIPTKEQVANMPAEKRAQFAQMLQQKQREQAEALRKAQMGIPNASQQQQPQTPAAGAGQPVHAQTPDKQVMLARLQAMYKEVERSCPKGGAVEIDNEGLQQAVSILKRLWGPTRAMQNTYAPALQFGNSDNVIKAAMRARIQIGQNLDETGNIRDYLSLTVQDLRQLEQGVNSYFKQIKMAKERYEAEKGRQQQAQQVQIDGQQAPGQAAQLQGGQQRPGSGMAKPQHSTPQQALPTPPAQHSGHSRKQSNNQKAPPAPTENKTFDWGAASPHGVPKYEPSRNELTSDKLKFPPNKKRKPNQPDSQGNTPVSQAGTPVAITSPSVMKAPSPEQQMRRQQAQVKQDMAEREREEQQRQWRCREELCEANFKGFETEEELKRHVEVEHAPVEDPLAFLLEIAAGAMGVDQEGSDLPEVKVQPRATPVPGVRTGVKRLTPAVKQEVDTPAMDAAKAGKNAAPTTFTLPVEPVKEKTLREAIEEKMGYTHTIETDPKDAKMADADEDNSWTAMLQATFNEDDAVGIHEWPSFGNDDNVDWGLRPERESSPEQTPSDGTSSSRESDISQSERLRINFEWDPWGNGDTHVPEVLRMQKLGLEGSPEQMRSGDDEAEMGNKDVGKVVDDEWDWSHDQVSDWDSMFGPQGWA